MHIVVLKCTHIQVAFSKFTSCDNQQGVFNSYCSCSFEAEIIEFDKSSHNMYSNTIVNFQESTTILNACTKKSLETYWIHHVCILPVWAGCDPRSIIKQSFIRLNPDFPSPRPVAIPKLKDQLLIAGRYYLPTPPLGQDMTQGQFLSGV